MPTKTKQKNILIVEDEKEMQEIYRLIFEPCSDEYKIVFQSNAQEALEEAKKEDYDLIILDIVMHPMPGDFFFFFVRQEAKLKKTPVLIVTVLDLETLSNLKKYQPTDFLQKPITKDDLFGKIQKMIG